MATEAVLGSSNNSSLLNFDTSHAEVPYFKNTTSASLNASYAYLADWNSMDDARMLADLLQQKVRIRKAYKDFEIEGGSPTRKVHLIITQSDNDHLDNLASILQAASSKYQQDFTPVNSGYVDKGKDFGSSYVQMIKPVKVAVLSGDGVNLYRFGEVWHFFEKQLHYPLTVLDTDYWQRVDLDEYDVLILPGGRYFRRFG